MSSIIEKFRSYSSLLYCARSGSTFLAKELSKHSQSLIVIPEFRTPLKLFWMSESKVCSLSSDDLMQLFERDYQIENIIPCRSDRKKIADQVASKSTRQIIDALLCKYVSDLGLKPQNHAICMKNSEFAYVGRRLEEVFPEMRYLHVVRDPRAVVNSMMNAKAPYDDKRPMARGVVAYAAVRWNNYVETVQSTSVFEKRLDINYEQLVQSPDTCVKAAIKYLGESVCNSSNSINSFNVMAKEEGLHRLVGGKAQSSRSHAWTEELTPWQIKCVDYVCKDQMAKYGYELAASDHSFSFRVLFKIYYFSKICKHYLLSSVRLFKWLAIDPRRASVRFQQFSMRLKGKN